MRGHDIYRLCEGLRPEPKVSCPALAMWTTSGLS